MPLTFTAPIEEMPELIAVTLQSSHRKSARVPSMTGRFPPLGPTTEIGRHLIANMTVEQAATLKGLAEAAYELEHVPPGLNREDSPGAVYEGFYRH